MAFPLVLEIYKIVKVECIAKSEKESRKIVRETERERE